MSDGAPTPPTSPHVFSRLLMMLRPHWGTIALAVVLLLMSLPAELFPGLAWMYVTDELILVHSTRSSSWLGQLFSLHGLITGKIHLLFSAITWMFAIYLFSELFGTFSSYLMNVVAQKFTLTVRNEVYHKLQCQSLAYLQRQRLGDLMSRAMGDVDELQSFLVNGIDQIVGDGLLWFGCVVLVMLLGLESFDGLAVAAGGGLLSAADLQSQRSRRFTKRRASVPAMSRRDCRRISPVSSSSRSLVGRSRRPSASAARPKRITISRSKAFAPQHILSPSAGRSGSSATSS